MKLEKIGLFALGTLFGLEGIKLLSSRDAKKVYAQCTAGVLRVRDCILDQATALQENCTDIYEEAKVINEERAKRAEEAEITDGIEVPDESEMPAANEVPDVNKASDENEAADINKAAEEKAENKAAAGSKTVKRRKK
ncbi:MAG: DUF6110 family protein [Lachnospiraceae bacterium]|nr:DUF6110 family protein [Lachnospiraceae bacterium]